MEWRVDVVYAYGISIGAGSIECADCGHRQEHAGRGPLPPCPRYRDSTHTRAGWRVSPARETDGGRRRSG
jgi:hypothetical protein